MPEELHGEGPGGFEPVGSVPVLVEKAIAECERSLEGPRRSSAGSANGTRDLAITVGRALFGLTNAVLYVGDRLDVLIGMIEDGRLGAHGGD